MGEVKKILKQMFCNHTYKHYMTNYFPGNVTERVYICTKCGKEVRVKDNEKWHC
mgnify:CR=1 FL=1